MIEWLFLAVAYFAVMAWLADALNDDSGFIALWGVWLPILIAAKIYFVSLEHITKGKKVRA